MAISRASSSGPSRWPGTLSGGEQQMLMIGRALMAKPKLLLVDGPSLGLSPVLVEQVFAIIERLHAEGISILLVEQNARVALAASSFGYILENGEIRLSGPSASLTDDPGVRARLSGRLRDQRSRTFSGRSDRV